ALRASAAAEATRRTAERLVRAQRVAGMGNWSMTDDGGIECSAELLRILDMQADEELAHQAATVMTRVVPADRDRVMEAANHLVQHGKPLQLEFNITRR